jgi:hypothetical protein
MGDQSKLFDSKGYIDKGIVGKFFDFLCNAFPNKTRGGIAKELKGNSSYAMQIFNGQVRITMDDLISFGRLNNVPVDDLIVQFQKNSNSVLQSIGVSEDTRSKFLIGLQALIFAKDPHMKDARVFRGKLNEGSPANGQGHYEKFLADGTVPAFWFDLIFDPNERKTFIAQYFPSQEKSAPNTPDIPDLQPFEPPTKKLLIVTKCSELPKELIDAFSEARYYAGKAKSDGMEFIAFVGALVALMPDYSVTSKKISTNPPTVMAITIAHGKTGSTWEFHLTPTSFFL